MQILDENGNFASLSSPLGLSATYTVYLRLNMLVVDFLLEITEVFLLDITVEALRANID